MTTRAGDKPGTSRNSNIKMSETSIIAFAKVSSRCHQVENAMREIKNENDFKQKFIDFDNDQKQRHQKYEKTVMVDRSNRARNQEAITEQKPSYIDKLAEDSSKYLQNKHKQIMSAYEFQKDRINEKYRGMQKAQIVTQMGEMSAQELQKYKDHLKQMKEETKRKQTDYGSFLKTQIMQKDRQERSLDARNTTEGLPGNRTLARNSSVPMVPGICSISQFLPKVNNAKHRRQIGL